MNGWVVTGTDTGVGKTVVSAALCACLAAAGRPVAYVKPVQSGAADGDDDAADVSALAGVPTVTGPTLGPPLAPAVAARLGAAELLLEELVEVVGDAAARHPGATLVVEGAGGVLVELGTDGTTAADLAAALSLPLLVVCRPELGTLNHTALTLEAIKRRGVGFGGLVVCGFPAAPDLTSRTNAAELDRICGARLAGVVPALDPYAAGALDAACEWFAPELGGTWQRRAWLAVCSGAPGTPQRLKR